MTTETPISSSWLSTEEQRRYALRWEEIQAGFIADPRGALERADELVANVFERLRTRYDEDRRALHGRWDPEETSTESLRTSLQSYRDMFEALLA